MRLFVFLLLVAAASAKVFTRCELAKTLKDAGMDDGGVSLANWVCLAVHESGLNTEVVNDQNSNGSTDYGIFQINSRWWCDDGSGSKTANGCSISCSKLLSSDISDAIACAKRVVRDPKGFGAWYGWVTHCKGKNVTHYTKDCKG